MANEKLFKKKSLKDIKDKEYLVKRNYIWLPVKMANKKVKIIPVDLANVEIIGTEKLKKTYKATTYVRKIKMARVYVGKDFIGKKIKLKIIN